jgi:hypothetical protein
MEDCSGISLQSRCWYWGQVLSVAVLDWNVSLTDSTALICDNSQKFSLEVVKLIRTGYNTNEEFCDNSRKLSVERRIIIWRLRETSI